MKLILFIFSILLCIQLNAQYFGMDSIQFNGSLKGLTLRPSDYVANPLKRYPLIVCLGGNGEMGTSLSVLFNQGIPKRIKTGLPMFQVMTLGDTARFLFVCPLSPSSTVMGLPNNLNAVIDYMISNYRVDTSKIMVSGYSQGANDALRYALWPVTGDPSWGWGGGFDYRQQRIKYWVMASPPYLDVPFSNNFSRFKTYNCGARFYHGANDAGLTSPAFSQMQNDSVNANHAGSSQRFLMAGYGHSAQVWDSVYSTNGVDSNINIYRWLVQSPGNTPPPPNQPPVAMAGADITITLPTNNTTLNGSLSFDPDGWINAYAWTKISGPVTYAIGSPAAASTALTNLVQGVYGIQLQVTDNSGAIALDTILVTVNAAPPPPPNQPPVANAGADISITLPTNSTTLNGSASTDPDGTISTYAWTKISGPLTFSITNATAATTGLTNLVQGVYSFSLLVTDNGGATAADTVVVTVNAAPPPPPNQPPVANAGVDISITLPVNNTTLNGSASTDPDGTISTFSWTEISGPATFSIVNAAAVTTGLTNLVQGVYSFRLLVTDNAGATAADTVLVTVNAALPPPPPTNQPPVANAGADISITLPTNSTTLNGTASSDPDGTISTYAWSYISGPATFTLNNASSATASLTNLVQGVYSFLLQVTDNAGASAADTVLVTVNAAPPPPNQPPVANAGIDIVITLPVSSTNLNGSASYDPDGSISTYSWNKISGTGATTILNPNTSTPTVIGLTAGQYVFELTVTDNNGAQATDQVMVTVNAAVPGTNQAPVANAGRDTSIALPIDNITLSGNKSMDPDGSIASFNWTQLSGPGTAIIATSSSVNTLVSGLLEGDYVFQLTVTDNLGAVSNATVKVSVINNYRYSEFFKIYPNPVAGTILNLEYIDDNRGKLRLMVYDANGRLAIDQEINKDLPLLSKQLDVSLLRSGMYYLVIQQSNGKKFTRPFVKQ